MNHTPQQPKLTDSQRRGYKALTVLMFAVLVVCVIVHQIRSEVLLHQREQQPDVQLVTAVSVPDSSSSTWSTMQASATLPSHLQTYQRHSNRRTSGTATHQKEWQSHAASTSQSKHRANNVRRTLVFDLNTADTLDLQQLYGIGPVYAKRIVNYRNLLGGYVNFNQLHEVYGLPDETIAGILPHLTLTPTLLRKIDINHIELAQLRRHPYLDYYQAKAIVQLRQQGTRFRQERDLYKVSLLDSATIARISPYIDYSDTPSQVASQADTSGDQSRQRPS